MIKVNVIISNKSWIRHINNPNSYLKSKVKKLNKNNKFFKNKSLEFSILLSNDREIKKLNKQFRKKNKSTDILSFPFHERELLRKMMKKKLPFYLGDVIINLKKIINKKKKVKEQLNELWIHGFIHLLGGRHKSDKEYSKMKRLEQKFYKQIS